MTSTYEIEILKKQATRKDLRNDLDDLEMPDIDDDESHAEFDKIKKETRKKYFKSCHGVDRDIDLLRRTIDVLAEQVAKVFPLRADGTANPDAFNEAKETAFSLAVNGTPKAMRPPATPIDEAIAEAQAERAGTALVLVSGGNEMEPPEEGEQQEDIVIEESEQEQLPVETLPPADLSPTEAEVNSEIKKSKNRRKAAKRAEKNSKRAS